MAKLYTESIGRLVEHLTRVPGIGEKTAERMAYHILRLPDGEAEALADRIAIIRQGQIIALDTPADLKTRLLGPPLLELRWRASNDGHIPDLNDLIAVEDRGQDWLRYRTARPEAVNPRLLHRLDEAAVEVITLSEVPRSLEDVYLHIVEEE